MDKLLHYSVVSRAIIARKCWNACNYCSMLHAVTTHETTSSVLAIAHIAAGFDSSVICVKWHPSNTWFRRPRARVASTMGESLIWQPAIYLANKFSLSST